MTIFIKNKYTVLIDEFKFKCCIGKKGSTRTKIEGDKKTPKGTFEIENLYFRKDRKVKPLTSLKCIEIKKNMGWCNDIRFPNKYNKLIKIKETVKHEQLKRKDYKYNYLLVIKYNSNNIIKNKGSAIFLHLTKNFKKTSGCIAVRENDFLVISKLLNRNSKISIN